MLESRKKSKENTGINNSLTKVGGEDVDVILPRRIMEFQKHYQQIPQEHESGPNAHKQRKSSPPGHDITSNKASYRRRKRGDCQSSSSF